MNIFMIYFYGFLFLSSCGNISNETDSQIAQENIVKTKTPHPTDSVLLLSHLDSLPKINFPFLSEFYNRSFITTIDLSDFREKELFNLPFKRIERNTATGSIDYDTKDTLFNLTDKNFKASWNLLAKTPAFIAIEVYSDYAFLVTLTYDFRLIDAIRTGYADPAGNVHWHANRHSIINKDLTVILQHESELQVDENYKYETETVEEKWFIDRDGQIKQK